MKGGLLRGLATFMILTELASGPKCGYEIGKDISGKLGDGLPPGYVYVMLNMLERKGLVVGVEAGPRRKKTYRLTDKGVQFLLEHEQHIGKLISLLQEVQGVVKALRQGQVVSNIKSGEGVG